MPNPAYKLAFWRGQWNRRRFLPRRPRLSGLRAGGDAPPLDLRVFTFCSRKHLAELAFCAASFLRHAGVPREWMVLSDGTMEDEDFDWLHALHPCLRGIRPVELPLAVLPATLQPFARTVPFGLKLSLLATLSVAGETCLYTDSDVLFFPAARVLLPPMLNGQAAPAHYLPDARVALDPRLLRSPEEAAEPINSGVVFLRQPLDWSLAAERWAALGPGVEADFFSEQTLCHLTLHAAGAAPLDPARWVLDLDDQTVWADRSAGRAIALRHYVAPVRHHFWNTVARRLRDVWRA